MSNVRPFRGLRPKPEYASRIACPPYDVLNTAEARAAAQGNPISFLRVNKAELEFPDTANQYSSEVYLRARENLIRLEHDGYMIRDARPCFYLYRLTMDGRSQTGLVALTSVDEYDRGLIKKHEHTRPEKVADRANHILEVQAQVGPVFTAFRFNPEIDAIFKAVIAERSNINFTSEDEIRHELWIIDNETTIQTITAAFGRLSCTYIADGHHRSEAASEVARRVRSAELGIRQGNGAGFFLNVLFPDRELRIMSYNRVVRDLNGLSLSELLRRAERSFEVSSHTGELTPSHVHEFGLYCEQKWYLLKARSGSFEPDHPTRSIDASILSANLLDPLLAITNPRTDKRIDFVGGIRGTAELMRLVDSGDYQIAFSLFPTSIEQLLKVADAGEVMPPKSTWFEPKLRDGMVVNLLTD